MRLTSPNTISLAPEKLLRKEFIEGVILEKLNPDMGFLNLFPRVNLEGATSFKHFRDEISAEDDIVSGVTSEPVPLTELARLPEIEFSKIQSQIGDTHRFGYALRFSKEIFKKENGRIDEVLRGLDRASYGIKRALNRMSKNALANNAEAATITLNDGSWKTSEKIEYDIADMKAAYDIIGYDYNLNTTFISKDSFYGAKKYFDALLPNGFTPNNMDGVEINKVNELTQDLIGLDSTVRPATMYYNVDNDFSTIEGSFVNVNVRDEREYPFNKVIEIWCEMGIGIHHPKAILYQPGV